MNADEQLVDALLKEQARKREADQELLAEIERALDGGTPPRVRAWRRAMPLSIAALLALSAGGIYWAKRDFSRDIALNEIPSREVPRSPELLSEGSLLEGAPEAVAKKGLGVETKKADRGRMPTDWAHAESAGDSGLGEISSAPLAKALPETLSPDEATLEGSSEALAAAPMVIEGKPYSSAPAGEPIEITDEGRIRPQPMNAEVDRGYGRSVDSSVSRGVETDEVMIEEPKKLSKRSRPESRMVPLQRKGGRDASVAPEGGEGFMFPGRGLVPADGQAVDRERYGPLVDQPWRATWEEPLSTFSIDVDSASYTNLRRMISQGRTVQPDAVRIEECINYFDYGYEAPVGDSPFAVGSLLASCPWKPEHLLARVAIKGREIDVNARPASNLVLLIDVSGSMQTPDKLPLLKRSLRVLLDELDERDRLGIVVYASKEGVVLPPTRLDQVGKSKAIAALENLEAGGSTNGGAGVKRAYQMALKHKVEEGVNRVILATDGDFNVGVTGQGELVSLIKNEAAKGVSLSILGFGSGNLNDAMMEAVTNDGNGNYFCIDGDREAKRVFLQKLTGTLVMIAKDVKIQVEFNPGKVQAYRLIGYANRVLRNQDFNNDKVDAGDIGAGHTVTAFYELVPVGVDLPDIGGVDELRYQRPEGRKELIESEDWFTLKLRYKHPKGDKSRLIETPVKGEPIAWEEAGNDFRMASAVALFGMKLRQMEEVSKVGWDQVIEMVKPTLAEDPAEQRAEFLELVRKLK